MNANLPVPTIEQLARMAPELNAWTRMAARAYGMYSGTNDALKKTRDKIANAKERADEIRQEMIMMTMVRLFAVMDRESEMSLQSAYRFLKHPNALEELARCYSGKQLPSTDVQSTCAQALDKFLAVYRKVDFKSFGRIQSFRNGQIAHLTWPEVNKANVTYGEVEKMVRACCELAGHLTLMISGKNDWPEDYLNEAHHETYEFWVAAIQQDANGRLDPGTGS
ncbi:hypothetical protein ACFWXH_22125 [Mesorhizobium sp. NPDC059054]|uniref:AbiU2 domain-containing protein n=1 Tax=Mesorhizobium sp. NPDC059054 TaxID=3346711 RepID=UPI0036877635